MQRIETGFLVATGAFVVTFCLLGLLYYDYSATLIRFPLLAAGVILSMVFARLILLRSSRGSPEPESMMTPRSALVDAIEKPRRRRALITTLWIFSIVPSVFALGFPVGLAANLLCVLRYFGETWLLSVIIAGASLLLSYGLFLQVLRVPLPILPAWWSVLGG